MNLFELYAEIKLDTSRYEKGVKSAVKTVNDYNGTAKEAEKQTDKLGDEVDGAGESAQEAAKGFKALASNVGKGLKTAAKVGTAAIAAAASGLTALTTASVKSYADYEQLVGGVETLFGAGGKSIAEYAASTGETIAESAEKYGALMNAQQMVLDNAERAYKTAGLSANEYMETVTSFSASLIQSLGGDTEAAAKKADLAITDMSDNANKMGTDMASIQNAYQGFAKQNYTMLDNLKLGYGGTKEEMERLLKDAEALDETFKLQVDDNDELVYSYADIVDAIHIVQTEMGITGTTAKEAATTIQGSFNSMKAAWKNVLTGIADENQDVDALINHLIDSAETFGDNVIPRIETALGGAAALIEGLAPKISERLPKLVSDLLPRLVGTGARIIEGLINGISENSDVVLTAAFEIISTLGESITTMLPQVGELGFKLLMTLVQGVTENADNVVGALTTVVTTLADGIVKAAPELIPAAVRLALELATALTSPETLDALLGSASDIILALADGIIEAVPLILEQAPTIIENLAYGIGSNAGMLLSTAGELLKKFVSAFSSPEALIEIAGAGLQIILSLLSGVFGGEKQVLQGFEAMFKSIAGGFADFVKSPIEWGKDLVDNFVGGIKEKWNDLKETVSNLAGTVKDFLGFSEPKKGPLSNFHTYAPDMMELFAKGIRDNEKVVTDQIEKSFDFGTRTIDADLAVKSSEAVSASSLPESTAATYLGGVSITINGAQYADETSLAKKIAEVLEELIERKERVYA